MANIGDWVNIPISHQSNAGVYLDAGDEEDGGLGTVLLPNAEMPNLHEDWAPGDEVRAFLYRDSEDRPVATLMCPKALPGECRYLEVVQISPIGAFLDWGLAKDLLLPFREQKSDLSEGKSCVVHVTVDPVTDRLIATQRLNRHLDKIAPFYEVGEEVDLLVYGKTDLGYKAVINDEHTGVLFANEVFRRIRHGERTKGYIKQVRPDGKIDLTLYKEGQAQADEVEEKIQEALIKRGGFLPLHDKSPAEDIYKALGVSKKGFKRAAGSLFKKRLIVIEKEGLRTITRDLKE